MRNYEYIIASLPLIERDSQDAVDAAEVIGFVSEQLSGTDRKILEQLLSGFSSENLVEDFYTQALKSRNAFIRKYFAYDLRLRNLKVQYLNSQLSRPATKDCVLFQSEEDEPLEGDAQILSVLNGSDILQRERGLDELLWEQIDAITASELFSLSAILAFVAKLKIVDRWQQLNPQTGRELLRKLISQIRSTYDNKKTQL